jgi:cytoskeletal protein CcmA (bactofilin family)
MKIGRSLEISGLIGTGMEVEGTVRFNRVLRVDGVVRGRIESYDTLVVGRSGRVDAEVIVGAMKVYGTVSGRIAVDRLVEIFPGGRVEGELHASAPAVQISEGGVFEGQLHMTSMEGDRREVVRETVSEDDPGPTGAESPEGGESPGGDAAMAPPATEEAPEGGHRQDP